MRRTEWTRAALFAGLVLALAGCSAQSAYEGIQASQQIECARLPPSQYDECMARASVTFEEYQRQREAVLDD